MSMPKATVDDATRDALLGLAIGDVDALREAVDIREAEQQSSGLDPVTFGLVKVAALIALDSPPASYMWQIANALDAGATPAEILGVLRAVAPQVGGPKIISAAPEIMVALGLAQTIIYTPAGPLVPALKSYWLAIHVAAMTLSTGVFFVGLGVFSGFYFSSTIISDSKTYGNIGAVFAILGAISAVLPRQAFRAASSWLRGIFLIAFLMLLVSGLAGPSALLRTLAKDPQSPARFLPYIAGNRRRAALKEIAGSAR